MADSNDSGFLRGDKTDGKYGPLVVQGPGGASLSGGLTDAQLRAAPVPVTAAPPVNGTATLANVATSTTSATLLAASATRKGATIYNDSLVVMYVKFGATASATSFTVAMAAGSYYEVPAWYTGIIDGILASSTGNARITSG